MHNTQNGLIMYTTKWMTQKINIQISPGNLSKKHSTSDTSQLSVQNIQCNHWWRRDSLRGVHTSNKNPRYRTVCIKPFFNDIVLLSQGFGVRVEGTDAIFFLAHNIIPGNIHKNVTHGRIVVDYRPQNDCPYHTRLTFSGNIKNI